MKILITLLLILASTISFGQELKFKIEGQKDTTVNLVRYFGKGLYYADTAELKNGVVKFDGSKQKAGILALFLPGQKMLEFIYNDENIFIEASKADLMGTTVVKTSEENKIFSKYIAYMAAERTKANAWVEERKLEKVDSDEYKALTTKIENTSLNVEKYQLDLIKNNPKKLVSKIVKMSMEVKIPESPVDEAGVIIDSNFRFKYYRNHFFDNVDLKDDRLVRTPIYHNKLSAYFSKNMMIQHWDTIIKYAFKLCDQFEQGSDMYQYNVSWITSEYEKSKIMGMDKVFVMMGERYYCGDNADGSPKSWWMKEESLTKLCEKVETHYDLVIGAKPPNISLRDSTDVNWKDFYSLDAEYTILYFWDPQCGHCTKITPKLQTLYEKKFRERNIEIFAVGKAIGEDFEKWKAFIRKHNLEFINVAVTDELFNAAMADARVFVPRYTTLESLNYQKTYDIYSTPKVFILDKDKKIIAKSLSISQLENMLDRLQDKADAEKLFPPEENPEDEQMH